MMNNGDVATFMNDDGDDDGDDDDDHAASANEMG